MILKRMIFRFYPRFLIIRIIFVEEAKIWRFESVIDEQERKFIISVVFRVNYRTMESKEEEDRKRWL